MWDPLAEKPPAEAGLSPADPPPAAESNWPALYPAEMLIPAPGKHDMSPAVRTGPECHCPDFLPAVRNGVRGGRGHNPGHYH